MTNKTVTVVHCWSAPRSRSTALLYSFEARSEDCAALDEPLYREWLIRRGDAVARPYRRALIDGTPPPPGTTSDDERYASGKWRRELLSFEDRIREAAELLPNEGVIFCKHMAKHSFLYDFENEVNGDDIGIAFAHKHLLLIRDPVAVLSSWGVIGPAHGSAVTPDEVGIIPLLSIFSALQSRYSDSDGIPAAYLDSDELAADPEATLRSTCNDLGIAYKDEMMYWKSGPHQCDGPWAAWWYKDVHKSSGWKRRSNVPNYGSERYRTLDPSLMQALRSSYPAYQFLKNQTRAHRTRGPPPQKIYEDPRNEHLLVWIGAPGRGRLVPRDLAGGAFIVFSS